MEPIMNLSWSSVPKKNLRNITSGKKPGEITALAYHENPELDEYFILMADSSGEIFVYKINMKIPPFVSTIDSCEPFSCKNVHSCEILEILNFYSVNMFITCAADHSVKVITLKNGIITQVQSIKENKGISGSLSSICFIKANQYFGYCNDSNSVSLHKFKIGDNSKLQMQKHWTIKGTLDSNKVPVKIRSSNDQFDSLFF